MSEQIYNLLRVLRDFVPELQDYSIEEMYEYWKQWNSLGHQGQLKDFILSNNLRIGESK